MPSPVTPSAVPLRPILLKEETKEHASLFFRAYLRLLAPSRRPYLWLKSKWPRFFQKHLGTAVDLDTSRMLTRFNRFHRIFFGRGFDKIHFNEEDLKNLESARTRGPIVFLMRNWGQVEYNFFNNLFLRKKLPLVVHNNMVRMGHWMPDKWRGPIRRQKHDRFFTTGQWPFNNVIFDLKTELRRNHPVLYCLDLPTAHHQWVQKSLKEQEKIILDLLQAQGKLDADLQLVPLNFIYDKHPGKEGTTLGEILFGEKEHPGYLRKIVLFLRNYKKRAVAQIGEAISLRELSRKWPDLSSEEKAKDILLEIKKAFDLETRQVTGPKLKPRRQIMTEILSDPDNLARLDRAANEINISQSRARRQAEYYLKEIASDLRFTMVQLWSYFLNWLFNRFYDGLIVDTEGIARIKKIAKDSPLVIVPCHKSHVDYLMMGYVFYNHDLSLPYVCAGINLAFWPLGHIFRKSGAFFIRRSFTGNKVYTQILKSYVAHLMRDGYFQEFFIEGTRSRSGKLFPPKMGILNMTVESFLEYPDIPDVYFVPVSVDYERVVEKKSYLVEVKGAKKEKEKFRDLLALPKFLKRRYGKVYVQFAEPISLRETLKGQDKKVLEDRPRFYGLTHELALNISRAITRVTTLIPSALAAGALLTPKVKSLTAGEILQKSRMLFNAIDRTTARISHPLKKNFPNAIQEALDQFVQEGLIRVHEGLSERFYSIPDEARLSLDFYKNGAIHFFAKPALYLLCKRQNRRGSGITLALLYREACQILSREFFLTGEEPPSLPETTPPWLPDLVLPILESYALTLRVLGRLEFKKMQEWLLVRKVLEQGELLQHKGDLNYPESLSRFNIQNALLQFAEMGMLVNHVQEMGPQGKGYFSPAPSTQTRAETEKVLELLLRNSG